MFENIGKKIKSVAEFFNGLGIVISVVLFLIVIVSSIEEESMVGMILSFVLLGVGIVISWLSSLALYGFGQLIQNSDIMVAQYKSSRILESNNNFNINDPNYKATNNDERTFEQVVESSNLSDERKKQIMELKEWLEDGLIDPTDCCKRIKQIASDQPEEIITKMISKL